MTWVDLLWFPPLMLAIAAVLGAAGSDAGWGQLGKDITRTFLTLTLGVVAVGIAIHVIAAWLAG